MKNEVRSLRTTKFTLFVYSVMVWGWGFYLLNSTKGVPFALALLLPVIISLPLLSLAFHFARSLRGLNGHGLFENRRAVVLYTAGIIVTVGGFALANSIFRSLHHAEYVVPGATLALGLHFLFVGLAFQERRAYLTLAVFCLTAIIVPLVVPVQFTLGSFTTISGGGGWMVATSIVGIAWLGSMTVRLYISGRRSLAAIDGRQTEGEQMVSQAMG